VIYWCLAEQIRQHIDVTVNTLQQQSCHRCRWTLSGTAFPRRFPGNATPHKVRSQTHLRSLQPK
jgi:hypothetical protein